MPAKRTQTKGRAKRPVRMRGTGLPKLSRQQANENKSRPLFALAIHPWPFEDSRHDYGIDGEVQITRPDHGGGSYEVTGKRFLVQLKSTDGKVTAGRPVPARIKVMHVRSWTESGLPVLLARCHLPMKRFYWRWVDDRFVAELSQNDPAWIGRDELTVHLPAESALDARALTEIESYVSRYRRTARRILAPGTYLDLQAKAIAVGENLAKIAREADVVAVVKRLSDLREALTRCTYVVALTGPARAGKSTLMNALLGREISPVGKLPTTAVPVMVVAGATEEAQVGFVDGHVEKGPATAAFLAEFATQEKNPENVRRVKLATVRLVNDKLEQGVAIADAPGLHDPSETMRRITDVALDSAHAVIYVLDVSTARNWGFSLTEQIVADLKRLRTKAERLFLVLNKADDVPVENREAVSAYVERELRKYELWADLPVPPMFLSAKAAWEWDRTGTNPLGPLEEELWKHLLLTQSTGVDRLGGSLLELSRAARDLSSLLSIRKTDSERAVRLRESLAACRRRREELLTECRRQRTDEADRLDKIIHEHGRAIREHIEQWLGAIPSGQDLPAVEKIRARIHTQVLQAQQTAWTGAGGRAYSFAQHIACEVERSLQQARAATGAITEAGHTFVTPGLDGLESLASEAFTEAWTGLIAGVLFGLLIETPLVWAIAIGGWLAGLVLGSERRRKRELKKVMAKVESAVDSAMKSVYAQVFEKVSFHLVYLESTVLDRIVLFIADADRQLKALKLPPGFESEQSVDGWLQRTSEAATEIVAIAGRLDPSLLSNIAR